MASANDQDVEHAMAALGASPIAYRNFRAEPSGSDRPAPPPLSEFPLIAAALPEAANTPLPAEMPTSPEPPAAMSPRPPMPAQPAANRSQFAAEPASPELPMTSPPAAATPTPQFAPSPSSTQPEPSWRRPAEAAATPLAAMFRILHTGASRADRPPEPRRGLQDLFRRL